MSLPFMDRRSKMARDISLKKGQLRTSQSQRIRPVNLFVGFWILACCTLVTVWKSVTLTTGDASQQAISPLSGNTIVENADSGNLEAHPIQQSKPDKANSDAVDNTIVAEKKEKAGAAPPLNPAANEAPPTIDIPGKDALPSAKVLLTKTPPFDDSNMIRLQPELIQSPNTVVTGYFRVPSKFEPGKYDNWMKNMLSLQDPMVIFTHAELVDQIKDLRQHALDRTVVIPLALEDLPIGSLYPTMFWEDQLDRDPEKRIHKSYYLFWIWLSKSWCVTQAIRLNPFKSDLFVWSDIGCFRNKKYNNKMMIQHRENVPPNEIIQMAHHPPNPPNEELFNDKYKHKANFYQSGSQMAGFKDTWLIYHDKFLETIDRFLQNDMIIVEDQAVLQSTCLSYPKMCAYITTDQVKDNAYFGLRYVLHNKGDFKYWRHPKAAQ